MSKKKVVFFTKFFFIPIILWILFTPWSACMDRKIAHFFYQKNGFGPAPLWDFTYRFAILPGWALLFCACVGYIYSFFSSYRSWRKPCLLLILTLAIGSGVIIHAIFKEQWGRPRPRQVTEFAGKQAFRPYYEPNFNNPYEPSKSFTSGHVSMGFIFFALGLLGIHFKKRWVFWAGMVSAWTLGIILGLARMARGGHFFSDVAASALIMWLTASTIYYIFFIKNENMHDRIDT